MINQISVFLENSVGRLTHLTKALAEANINLRAISIADTADFGILRLIVDKESEAMTVLKKEGFTIRLTKVLMIEIDDVPGELSKVMQIFSSSGVNIEYLYASLEKKADKAVIIFKLNDFEAGLKLVKEKSLPLVENF
ncbi:MAG: ACT domain-containing protein [Termitinemataceae bacterium]|nr:MAG: ACT domain-containing protein [Termitinemataceae bacterium]